MSSKLDSLKVDLKQLFNSKQVETLSKHLTGYEKRVKELVKELDLKSRDAREKSREQLARFAGQVRKTSLDVEKNVKVLLHQEGKVLNQKVTELVSYLKSLATSEKKAAAPVQKAAAATPKARATAKAGVKKTSAPRAKKSSKKSAESSAQA